MPLVDRMPAVFRHVMANNGENVATIPHVEHAKKTVVTSDNTAAPLTYTPAMFLGGIIHRDCNGAVRSDVTPSAAAMIAAMPGAFVGQSIDVHIRNTSAGAFTITVTAGSGCTLNGTMTIAQNNGRNFRLVWTAVGSAPTYTLYSIGLVTGV